MAARASGNINFVGLQTRREISRMRRRQSTMLENNQIPDEEIEKMAIDFVCVLF